MNQEQANELRDKIINDIKPILIDDIKDESEKLNMLMKIIETGKANYDIYNQAYMTIKNFSDNDIKANALLSLLDAIDYNVDQGELDSQQDNSGSDNSEEQ